MAGNAFNQLRDTVNELSDGEMPASPAPLIPAQRSGASPETSPDNLVMPENPQATFSPGTFRPHWPLNARAIFAPVASIRSSATPTVNTNTFASKTGIHNNPTTTNQNFTVIPDLSISLQCNANVEVAFVGTFQTATANDTAGFAIFRDNRQISRTFQGSSAASNIPFTMHFQITDTPTAGVHAYDARWQSGSNTLQAVGLSRSIEAKNHRAV